MKDYLILPGNDQELFDTYFDKVTNTKLLERFNVIKLALQNQLHSGELRRNNLIGISAKELSREKQQLEREIFQASMKGFAVRLCELQTEICEQNYWDADGCQEGDAIRNARMPDLVADPTVCEQISAWWTKVDLKTMLEIAIHFESDFGDDFSAPEYQDDPELEDNIEKCWRKLTLCDRERIYRCYNESTSSDE